MNVLEGGSGWWWWWGEDAAGNRWLWVSEKNFGHAPWTPTQVGSLAVPAWLLGSFPLGPSSAKPSAIITFGSLRRNRIRSLLAKGPL